MGSSLTSSRRSRHGGGLTGGIEIEVGSSLDRLGADFIAAWKAAETGQTVEADRRIHFRDRAAVCAVLTPERYDLLRHLRRDSGSEPAAVSRALGRDEDRIARDIEVLAEPGLVVRAEDGRLTALLDEIVSTIRFAA